jgi:hypothetical protein
MKIFKTLKLSDENPPIMYGIWILVQGFVTRSYLKIMDLLLSFPSAMCSN